VVLGSKRALTPLHVLAGKISHHVIWFFRGSYRQRFVALPTVGDDDVSLDAAHIETLSTYDGSHYHAHDQLSTVLLSGPLGSVDKP
jgi:hypothetical protein